VVDVSDDGDVPPQGIGYYYRGPCEPGHPDSIPARQGPLRGRIRDWTAVDARWLPDPECPAPDQPARPGLRHTVDTDGRRSARCGPIVSGARQALNG
jgi:hypothetical protein